MRGNIIRSTQICVFVSWAEAKWATILPRPFWSTATRGAHRGRPGPCAARWPTAWNLSVVCGDGTFAEVQESADVAHCSAMVAVTGRDEDNLIVCQLAKQVFKVKRTVARVNNPKNAAVLKKLGVDIAVSATDNLTHLIEREVETAAIQQLLSLAGGRPRSPRCSFHRASPMRGKRWLSLSSPRMRWSFPSRGTVS